MTKEQLQDFLHRHIPATAALGVVVAQADAEQTVLHLPHELNRNHKQTVFGGSIALAATACGWAAVFTGLSEAEGNIVIQQGETRYLKPARGSLTVITRSPEAAAWVQMRSMLARHGKGKIELETQIFSDGILAAEFRGKYVALRP
ncbi:YiiD C-terminal domain-containing protein [Bergeriella denitrificans]|uniref:Putative thioesterase domain n=1 Tax=Bergeriella denitrificans TaxID=494 RepID=A0A378UH03_BERDE|nr:YiiD C-terminal domain-containing protein [Bergeriella denitrificans]STZ75781.1 putative thioesterase domain [Bergeriella denitrificans]